MKIKFNARKFAELCFAMSAITVLIAGCSGGGGSGAASTTSVSGVVQDGYLSGVTVCLDKNSNTVCDAGEPYAVTDASGVYSISGVTASDVAAYPLVAQVPASAVDSDNPASAVGQAYVLTTPAGQTVINPITSILHQLILDNPASSVQQVIAQLKTDLQISSAVSAPNLFADYIADAASSASATSGVSATVHNFAKLVASSLAANYSAAASGVSASKIGAVQGGLLKLAKLAAQSEGSNPNPASGVIGVEDPNTVRATILATTSTATPTQAVTVNFDVINSTTAATGIKACNPVSINSLVRWDQTPLAATAPTAATMLTSPGTYQTVPGVLNDLRFYISNVLLWDANGNAVPLAFTENAHQSKNVALLDFGYSTAVPPATCVDQDAASAAWNTSITGKVAPGTYTGISFTLGVPVHSADLSTKLDHSDPTNASTPLPLQNTALNWSWQYGRKFVKIQFVPTTPAKKFVPSSGSVSASVGSVLTLNYHIGSTGCLGNPATVTGSETSCTNPNELSVTLNNFNASSNIVALDLAALFAGSDLTYDGGGASGCMSGTTDPECGPIFKALGISLTTGLTLTGSQVQTVFSVK